MNLCIVIKSYPWYHQWCGLHIWFICLIFCKLSKCSPGVYQSKFPFACQLPNQQIRSVFLKCKVLLNLGCFGRSYFAKDRSVSTRSCCDFSFKHFLQQRKSLSQWKSWFQRQKHFVINSNWEIRNQWINAKLGSCLDSRISFKPPLYMMSDGPEGVNCTSYRPLYLKHTHYNPTKGPACM